MKHAEKGKKYTSQEMNKLRIREDQIWNNISKLGSKPKWIVEDKPKDWGR